MAVDLTTQMADLERQIAEKRAELVRLKKELGRQPVGEYTLHDANGLVSLRELFGDRDDLIVIHNMGTDCAYCTLWADGFNGLVPHLEDRAALALVSPDPPDVQGTFARERGWAFRIVSGAESDFIADMGFKQDGPDGASWMPGVSVFQRGPDGSVTRVAQDFFGPGDPYCGLWHLFELLADGPDDWQPAFAYGTD